MKKKKRYKLKKQGVYLLLGIVIVIVCILLGINYYHDFKYKQTLEYKITLKGYSLEDAKILQEKCSEEEITSILEKEKNDTIISLVKEKYFLSKNLEKYLSYYEDNTEEELKEIVAIVNVDADKKWYEEELESDTSLNELVNVNKFYALSEDYTPENLVNISLTYSYGEEGENQLIDYAYEKFIEMWNAANEEGYYLMVNSSYRDYQSQQEIYDYRKTNWGEKKADETAARAGHSEHQTGLVIDITSKTEPDADSFKDSNAYKWLVENAYLYGFIERYQEGKTYLTGYTAESWHWRYVGKEAAKILHEEDITFDEYYAFYIVGNN